MYNIICFSFAGGNAYSYNIFRKYLPSDVSLVPVEYPGRGKRFSEPLITHIDALVEDLYQSVRNLVSKPYFIYGHSMGGLMAYKVAHYLKSSGMRMPDGLFITGCGGPSTPSRAKHLHDLPFDQLIKELETMQGIPKEVLKDRDFMNFYSSILRADFKTVASFSHDPKTVLDIPIKVITGLSEDISKDEALAWQEATTCRIDFKQLEGGHFFIFDQPQIIAQELLLCRNQWKMHTVDP